MSSNEARENGRCVREAVRDAIDRGDVTDAIHQAVLKVPPAAWTAAVEPGGEIRDGAWIAERSGDCLKGWPKGMRLIVRKERPHPGAQLRRTRRPSRSSLKETWMTISTTEGKMSVGNGPPDSTVTPPRQ
jgi:hypothetical protein